MLDSHKIFIELLCAIFENSQARLSWPYRLSNRQSGHRKTENHPWLQWSRACLSTRHSAPVVLVTQRSYLKPCYLILKGDFWSCYTYCTLLAIFLKILIFQSQKVKSQRLYINKRLGINNVTTILSFKILSIRET